MKEEGMTREERNNKLKHFITCMKCEVSGKCCDENCPIQYDAGHMGEIIENLEEISKILEQESILNKVRAEIMDTGAYEQEVNGKTEFLKGINYCLGVIDKYKKNGE